MFLSQSGAESTHEVRGDLQDPVWLHQDHGADVEPTRFLAQESAPSQLVLTIMVADFPHGLFFIQAIKLCKDQLMLRNIAVTLEVPSVLESVVIRVRLSHLKYQL